MSPAIAAGLVALVGAILGRYLLLNLKGDYIS